MPGSRKCPAAGLFYKMCLVVLSGQLLLRLFIWLLLQLFKIVLGFTPRRRAWKACSSQNDDFLPRFGIHPFQIALQGTSIPKRFGTTHFRLLCGPFRVICVALSGGLCGTFRPVFPSRFSRCVTSGRKSAFHAVFTPDLSHQEMARQFLLFGKNFIYFVRK